MKTVLAFLFTLLISSPSFAATAFWTGRSQQVQTVTYQWVWNCEYNYNGQTFWRMFQTSCPSNINVQ